MTRATGWNPRGTTVRRVAASDASLPTPPSGVAGSGLSEILDFDPEDIDPEELREFMSGDLIEVRADPSFKERLRGKLWEIVRMRRRNEDDDSGS